MRHDHRLTKCLATLVFAGLSLGLKGCVPAAIVGGATAVGASAAEERGFGGILSDAEIKTRLNFIYSTRDPGLFSDVDIVVRQGRVLLTGTVETLEKQINAVRYAWEVKGVTEVIDEIKVGQVNDLSDTTKDAWITTQLKTQLLFDGEVSSANYNIQTINGTLYLMGVAQDQEERDHVLNTARHINGVQKVVNYITLKDTPLHFKEDGSFHSPLEQAAYQTNSVPHGDGPQHKGYQQAAPAQRAQPAQQASQPTGLGSPNRSSAFD